MQMLQVVFMLALFGGLEQEDESEPVDALVPEQVRLLILELDNPSFQKRDQATRELFSWGQTAVYPLAIAADEGTAETSVRAFEILRQLYRKEKGVDPEAVETVLQVLKHSDNLTVAARAQETFDNNADLRQERAIAQIEKLGGIINFKERGLDRQLLPRPTIEYIVLGRDWAGGDSGLELLARIEEVRTADVPVYIIRGVHISDESTQNLRAEIPFLVIQYRGPARLGVHEAKTFQREEGCLIGEVDPGSAADVAGLRQGDMVIEIDGKPIADFQKLVNIIETKEPGQRVPIVYRRGAEIQKVIAELQTWKRKPRHSDDKSKPN